jgi:hypothetical protein
LGKKTFKNFLAKTYFFSSKYFPGHPAKPITLSHQKSSLKNDLRMWICPYETKNDICCEKYYLKNKNSIFENSTKNGLKKNKKIKFADKQRRLKNKSFFKNFLSIFEKTIIEETERKLRHDHSLGGF